MKFLNKNAEGKNLMPLNFQYIPGDYKSIDDVLYITYRDLDTGLKYTETIEKPKIEIYIVKPEYRGIEHIAPSNRIRDYIEVEYLDKKEVHYSSRKYEAAKFLNVNQADIMSNPFVLGLDVKIEHFYFSQFKLEYGNDLPKIPRMAFADIETEIKYAPYTGIAPAGTVPISLITIIDVHSRVSYTLALYFKDYGGIDEFWKPENLKEFKKELDDSFSETYGKLKYELMLFDSEDDLLSAFWNLVKIIDPDFLEFWNMPFDMGNIIERATTLGIDPGDMARDTAIYNRSWVSFQEDRNPKIHKRRHICSLPVKSIIVDQMVEYAVIRSAGSTIPDFKLNTIADKELGDKKVEYAEDYGSIADFPYMDYRRFVKYNIKDVLLQVGIDDATKDSIDIYGRMYDFSCMTNEVATTTTIVANYYRSELLADGKIMHNNKNKVGMVQADTTIVYDETTSRDDSDSDLEDALNNISDSEAWIDVDGKKIKFDGAIVLNPTRMSSSGFDNMKYIHNNVIDEDITAEYPSSIQITNLSNETFIGKFILDEEKTFELPIYNYTFANNAEKAQYKNNISALALETFAGGDILVGAELFLGLPNPSAVLNQLDLSKIIKKKEE